MMNKLPGAVLLLVCLQIPKPDCLCSKPCLPVIKVLLSRAVSVLSAGWLISSLCTRAGRGGPSVSGNSVRSRLHIHLQTRRLGCREPRKPVPGALGEVSFSGNHSLALRSFLKLKLSSCNCGAQKGKTLYPCSL